MSPFEKVIQEFHQRRLEKEILSEQQKRVRMQELYKLAEEADYEMKQRRRSSRKRKQA